ncbi:MAG: hypothetical protein ACKVQK_16260 [Burkholderiales bacterium]
MLVLPGVFTRNPQLLDRLGTLALPALQRLLAKGRAESQSWEGIDTWLMEKFNVARQQDWPSAPFSLLGHGTPPDNAFWAHADPVTLRADRDSLLLADASLLDINAEEAQAIGATVNKHFAEELQLHIAAPDRWYARFDNPPPGETTPLAKVTGRALEPGRGAMRWFSLMNEIQMLLHDHPVNEAREARGAAPINGVWLWGAGRLAPVHAAFKSVTTSSALARGLARHAGISNTDLPANANLWMEQSAVAGIHICFHEALATATKRGDAEAWLNALQNLEQFWFSPLLDALQSGRIGMLTLLLGAERTRVSIELVKNDLRRFWRRPKPLDRTLGSVSEEHDSPNQSTP